MLYGILNLPWWGMCLATLGMIHFTVIGITLYLHRCQAHRALELHPVISHIFRLWLWLSTAQNTKEWASVHRKHHAHCETEQDPHSPVIYGLKKVLLEGAELYRKEATNPETLARYGQGTPDDWIERHLYTPYKDYGVAIMFVLDLLFFGVAGITIWALQMMFSPVCAAGIINGVGHYWGYRNFECQDAARNIVPWGIFLGGEELHNNHHTYGTSAKFSVKKWEFDLGWQYIRILSLFGLAKAKRIPPVLHHNQHKQQIDAETLKAIITNRFAIMSAFGKTVVKPVFCDLKARQKARGIALKQRFYRLMMREESLINDSQQQQLRDFLSQYDTLKTLYQYRLRLQQIWEESATTTTPKELLQRLQEWCQQAEKSSIGVLRDFAAQVRTYSREPVLA